MLNEVWWQASSGGRGLVLLKRFWLLLVMLCLATWLGVGLLVASDERLMSGIFAWSSASTPLSA